MVIIVNACENIHNEKVSIENDYQSHRLWNIEQWKNVNDNDNQYQLACEVFHKLNENHSHLGLIIIINACEKMNNVKM